MSGTTTAASALRRRAAGAGANRWVVLVVLFVSLLSVVVVVRETLHLSVTNRANADVVQEIEEFRTFTDEGVDPETSKPFTSAERLLTVYLSRQRPGTGEAIRINC